MRIGIGRKTYDRLNEMVDRAMDGSFRESDYDESELSKLEVKWMHFLSASTLSAHRVEEERQTLKSLIADISHQTRTPLANLKLYSELLAEQDLDEESRSLVNEIGQQSARLEFLIQSLVKMSRLETGTIQVEARKAPVGELLHGLYVQGRGKALEKKIQLVVEPFEECEVCYDGKWTLEAIYNVLDNAIKYSPEGSCIRIRSEAYEMFHRISIEDEGMGISEEEQARIFQRFYRSPRVQQISGVGLGLYLTREIITRCGGYLRVESKENEGAVFHIYLPVGEGGR